MTKFGRNLPNVLIGLGVVCLITFAVYEGAQYPWKLLFAQLGLIELSDELPDPDPLPDKALSGQAVVDPQAVDGIVPVQGEVFTPRPEMNLTQLGVIKIPKIQISENIVEGADSEMLYAVGHVRDTAMPGEAGNCVLAAHRLYVYKRPFRYLDKMESGDLVYITDDKNSYTYEVFRMFEIEPTDTWVLQPQDIEENLLTLLTCTPVVNPTRRLIVWCRLVDSQPLGAAVA